jgi:hypothetical protein
MAGSIRRLALGAVALPFLLLAMSGWARAGVITVNTLEGGSQPAPLCTLEDAVRAANSQAPVGGCAAGTSHEDTILFAVTGTIFTDDTMIVTDSLLSIEGPYAGSAPGPTPAAGIVIDGGGTHEIISAQNDATDDFLALGNVTLAHGSITTPNLLGPGSAGGAILFQGYDLIVTFCTFSNNSALPSGASGFGGAIYVEGEQVQILNSTFVDNSATFGGALYNGVSDMALTNDTFSGNSGSTGAGALAWSPSFNPSVRGIILAKGSSGSNCQNAAGDEGYNLSDDNSCGFTGTSKNNVNNLDLDPMGLQNNGGPTDTIALEAGSEAIAFDKNCLDIVANDLVTFDQRVYPRPNSPTSCSSGAYEFGAVPSIVLLPNGRRVQLAKGATGSTDEVNMAFTFIDNGPGVESESCDNSNNALDGLTVRLAPGSCADMTGAGLPLSLEPFEVQTINHQSYGTLFAKLSPGPGTVSAKIVQLKTPAEACGEFSLNIEVAGIDSASYGLEGNPFALIITDKAANSGCFDIDNAIVGNQIPQPAVPVVRRGVRRGARR